MNDRQKKKQQQQQQFREKKLHKNNLTIHTHTNIYKIEI